MSKEVTASYARSLQMLEELKKDELKTEKSSSNGLLTRVNNNDKMNSGVDKTQPAYRVIRMFRAVQKEREKQNEIA
tara:strand:- start:644 stop:871 length:228 start_codon:yes stop_codon:yes gene_type:complete